MKKKKMTALFLSLILLSALSAPAFALNFSDFTDASAHWAEKTLERGFTDGLISGFEDETLRPDDAITTAQMIAVLCRVLNAPKPDAPAAAAFPADAWYADDAQKALSLGLISESTADLDLPMLRQDALSMLAKAFCLVPAAPDLSAIEGFSDYGEVTAQNRAALAELVSRGVIEGFDGALSANSSITRAEFITVLYRIVSEFTDTVGLNTAEGGAVIKGDGSLSLRSFSNSLWFDCSAEQVSLTGVTAKELTLLCPKVKSFKLNSANLDTLSLLGAVEDLSISQGSSLKTLRVCGALKAQLSEAVQSAEIVGSGADLSLGGKHDSLKISGSGNTVLLTEDCVLDSLIVTGSSNTIRLAGGSSVISIDISGEKNKLEPTVGKDAEGETLVGENTVSSVKLSGSDNQITLHGALSDSASLGGSGNVLIITSLQALKTASVSGRGNWLTLTCGDMDSLEVGGEGNTVHKCYEGAVSAITVPGSGCVFRFYTGNTAERISVTGSDNEIILDGSASHITVDGVRTDITGAGRAENITVNAFGCNVSAACSNLIDNGYEKDVQRVLEMVNSSYAGDFTLQWAQENDYKDYEKELFVNAKGYSSKTGYLIWVSRAMQRVNIFEGTKEDWKLSYSCIVATGASHSQTPVGVYYTTYLNPTGWTTATYTCRPVVGFKTGSGYAFHSRLYYPNSTTLTDADIGMPISHGCVRMYDEDVWYIYNNIPLGTTVVVF